MTLQKRVHDHPENTQKMHSATGVMPLREHLRELRKRLLWSIFAICVGAVAGWFMYESLIAFIQNPLTAVHTSDTNKIALNFHTIGSAFNLRLKIVFYTGFFLASPFWIYQFFAFITPALTRKERRYLFSFTTIGVILFGAGGISGILVMPKAVEFLTAFTPVDTVSYIQAETYISFYLSLVVAFGLSFLLPEALVFLNFIGVLPVKRIVKLWRWILLGCFTCAAIINPLPSPWPMVMQALVLIGLFLIAILLCLIREQMPIIKDFFHSKKIFFARK